MPSGKLLLFLGIIISFTACAPPVYSPPAPPEIILVQVTPSLSWMTAIMNNCALRSGRIGLVVDETNPQKPDDNSLQLRLGETGELGSFTYNIGQDALVFIVNPQNPIGEIEYDVLQSIYGGTITNWDQLGGNASEIGIWQYPDGMETRLLMEGVLNDPFYPTVPMGFAPNPRTMLRIIATNLSAIGYIPRSFMDDSVRQLGIIGLNSSDMDFPILASSMNSLTPAQSDWLVCLTDTLAQ